MKKCIASTKEFQIVLEYSEELEGYSVYVFDSESICIRDYLQDSLEVAKQFVEKNLGYGELKWRQEE